MSSWTASRWNALCPVGTAVRYFPVLGVKSSRSSAFRSTFTRSIAWELGDGTPVVKIEGQAGGVALSHLQIVERAPDPSDVCPGCKATRAQIHESGHNWLDDTGRPTSMDAANRVPCPEACTCLPECFSMAEHNAFYRGTLPSAYERPKGDGDAT